MSIKSVVLSVLTFLSVLAPPALAYSQCKNQIDLVPLPKSKAANEARDFVRFRYSLSDSDSLLIQSHGEAPNSMGPYDTGFVITRDGKTIQSVRLSGLPEFRHEEADYSESFTTLAVTRACRSGVPVYFVNMQYMGDQTSSSLIFTVVPTATGYEVFSLPMISGGVLDVSIADPFHLKTWDNLHEGDCEACETRYEITEFEIREGKPVRTRRYRTRHLFVSGNPIFDDRRRIRFVP
jgi:hypothetical protein